MNDKDMVRDPGQLTRGDDGRLHWKDVRNDLYSAEERQQTDEWVAIIGALVMRRKELGLTQEQLAERTGLKQSAIARLESGSTIPRLDTLIRVAEALDLKLGFIPKESCDEVTASRASA